MNRPVVTITLDTEVDHSGDSWKKSSPLRFRSVTEGVPRLYTPLFRRHGARPTYLVTTEVMDDPASVEALARVVDGELGTHLHGDHVAPEPRAPQIAGSESWDFTAFYPEPLERAKLETITRQFRDRFGRAPRSYRAGRYAASGRTGRLLAELGYRVETSVTPGIRWVHELNPENALDFRGAPLDPYHPSESDLARAGSLPIWEVPITILPMPSAWSAGLSLAQRALGRPVQRYPAWLRPSTTSLPWLAWVVWRRLRDARAEEPLVLNIMMHSMEVIAGASPYSPTEVAAARILKRLDLLLGQLARLGARFVTLTELADLLDARRA
jgi:hypothetical protein